MSDKTYYITTTIPYVNAAPHIGFALEILQADTLARFKRQAGFNVFMNFGTDEHGLKIYRKAQEQNKDPQTYCDEYAAKFGLLKEALNLSYDNFIRTTDKYHLEAAQEFWKLCDQNGDIYKKIYKTKYCVGCELERTDSELVNDRCPFHPGQDMEILEEENYFFRFSKYQDKLLKFYETNPDFVVPESRFNEIKNFVRSGLEDFSVSRLKKKMPWGVDVPNDPDHVMYVWFDALVNYISTIGWPKDIKKYRNYWPGTQIAGKDNLRQQTAIWQAMLISAGLPNTKQIFIHGFITSEGQRISKSLGNVIDPIALTQKYGTDPLRYYLLREIPPYDDGDFSETRFKELYNADLANGLGNLVARVAKLCEKVTLQSHSRPNGNPEFSKKIQGELEVFRFDEALTIIWGYVRKLDQYINEKAPWKETDEKELTKILQYAVDEIRRIGYHLKPFLPQTAEKILAQFNKEKIISGEPLFPRLV